MIQIFISYAREDYDAVRQLYNRLRDAGYKPWMDKVDLRKGADFAKAIPKVLCESDLFIVCLSTRSVDKRSFIQREINLALDTWEEKIDDDLFIFPVRLENCRVPDRINKFNWTDLFGDEHENEWNALLMSLHEQAERLGKAPPAVPKQDNSTSIAKADETLKNEQTKADKHSVTTFPFTTVTLDQHGKEIKRQELQAKQYIEELGTGIQLEVVEIPGGTFLMGAPKGKRKATT